MEYAIDLPVRTVGESLRRWGFTPKAPRRHSRDQDPEEVRHWIEEGDPVIERLAARAGAEIQWCDETGAAADHLPRRGYSRRGTPTTMEVPDSHIRMNPVAALSNEGSVHFLTHKGAMDSALFITFLGRLLDEVEGKVFLITDRLPAHTAAAVEEWVAAHQERLELFFLPAYAPERNAEEYLHNDMKGSINATGLPDDREGLRSRIEDFMARLKHLPERVRSYFSHPCVQYAAGL
jgi:hypothetical protein